MTHKKSPPAPSPIRTVESLRWHLQEALLIEHAVIPPYLAAWLSIQSGSNLAAAGILRSVLVEEMLHLTLVGNLLNAVGGEPRLTQPGFVPSYPHIMPYSADRFHISIEKFSRKALHTFLKIERPAKAGSRPRASGYQTLGQFYAAIVLGIESLCRKLGEKHLFSGDPKRQVPPGAYYGTGKYVVVTDRNSAMEALREIVSEGEGSGSGVFDADPSIAGRGREPAHYYRFEEILAGRLYRAGDTPRTGPRGDKIAVDFTQVYPMSANTKLGDYPPGSPVRAALEGFSAAYWQLLAAIEDAFNGQPGRMNDAIAAMFRVENLGRELMRTPSGKPDGSAVGLCFEQASQPRAAASPSEDANIDRVIATNLAAFRKPGVLSVRPGWKIKDGWPTNRRAIVAIVEQKRANVSPSALIPAQVGPYITDVRQATPKHLALFRNPELYVQMKATEREEKHEPEFALERDAQTGRLLHAPPARSGPGTPAGSPALPAPAKAAAAPGKKIPVKKTSAKAKTARTTAPRATMGMAAPRKKSTAAAKTTAAKTSAAKTTATKTAATKTTAAKTSAAKPPKGKVAYTPAPGVTLDPVTAKMSLNCQVSPDAGWPALKAFLGDVQKQLTVGMYDFTSAHVLQTLLAGMTKAQKLALVLDHPPVNPTANQTDEDTEQQLSTALQQRLAFAWAAAGDDPMVSSKIFPTSYHIKVAVKDLSSFWLSSGNWNNSNQPDVNPFSPAGRSAGAATLRDSDRDWHVVVEHAGLAKTFDAYLQHDLQEAAKLQNHNPITDAKVISNPDPKGTSKIAAKFFPAKQFNNVTVKIQPLLTPDEGAGNYAANITELIQSAKKTVYVQTQYLHPPAAGDPSVAGFRAIVDALAAKIAAGLDVRLIFSEFEVEGWLEQLQSAGIPATAVKIQQGVHNKGIVVDSSTVALGSQNWSTDGALLNRDASLIIFDANVAQYYEQVFLFDWENMAEQKAPKFSPAAHSTAAGD